MRPIVAILTCGLGLMACGSSSGQPGGATPRASSAEAGAVAEADNVILSMDSSAGPIVVERVAAGLEHPWGMAFLPDGRMLVTERPGRLRLVDSHGVLSDPLEGLPDLYVRGQGGLLDVALDPAFEQNGLVYLSYSKPGRSGQATTALGRGRLVDGGIEGFADIFVQQPLVNSQNHFGSRIVFNPDGTLFLALSERFQFTPAQDLSNTLGKVVRLNPDGSIPRDNPFVGQDGVDPAIWSYGHRNIQAAALEPESGDLWIVEFGPMGGDELNRPEAGKNYGWPIVSWGSHYDGRDIPDPPTHPEFEDAVKYWNPVISPSGMVFYTGDVFESWRGSAFVGGLSGKLVDRLRIEHGEVIEEERLAMPARIRDVVQGPDGVLYLLTDHDDGQIWRIRPAD